jgi:hypothetical protein
LPEIPTWKHPVLRARSGAALVYDPIRGRVVLFGGSQNSARLNDTWYLQGNVWSRGLDAPAALVSRANHAMAYDVARARVVLFGGSGHLGASLNDTWFLEENTWREGPPAPVGLAPRHSHRMVYDAAKKRVVLFGGHGDGFKNDTWFLQGDTWMPGPAAPPLLTERADHAMAYDVGRSRLVLFGGVTEDNTFKQDTWFLEEATWVPGPPGPSARYGHVMAYDPKRGRMVVFGGNDFDLRNDTWFLQGDTWMLGPAPETGLTPRYSHMTYDAARERMVLFGGADNSGERNDTWFMPENFWTKGPLQVNDLAPRSDFAIAYDPLHGRTILFGGDPAAGGAGPFLSDTWFSQGGGWIELPSTALPAPAGRRNHAMAYDTTRRRLVLFGGFGGDANTELNDTWYLAEDETGESWQAGPAAPSGPNGLVPRQSPAMVYDAGADRLILLGGDSTQGFKNDTWILNGDEENWTAGPPAPMGLTGRFLHALTYDPVAGRTLLFGGHGHGPPKSDSWVLKDETWTPAAPPPPGFEGRHSHAMAYDGARGRITLFGGLSQSGPRVDTLAFEGTGFTEVLSLGPPLPAGPYPTMGLTYDPFHPGLSLFRSSYTTSDQWIFRYQQSGMPDEDCQARVDDDKDGLSGCADPDCWGICTPLCPPHSKLECYSNTPRCGDGEKNSALENCRNCPEDMGPCVECGDFVCTKPEESAANCPGDCS